MTHLERIEGSLGFQPKPYPASEIRLTAERWSSINLRQLPTNGDHIEVKGVYVYIRRAQQLALDFEKQGSEPKRTLATLSAAELHALLSPFEADDRALAEEGIEEYTETLRKLDRG